MKKIFGTGKTRTINAVIFVHGMTTEMRPPDPVKKYYKPMWNNLVSKIDGFAASDWLPIFVTWGNVFPGDKAPFRGDQRLSEAEKTTSMATRKAVKLPGSARVDFGFPLVRQNLEMVRDRVLRGISDAIYYTSVEGEERVRKVVYGQVLSALKPLFKRGYAIRLHVIAHSLSNAVAHDFLYGIFNTIKTPDFAKDGGLAKVTRRSYLDLRQLASGPSARVTFGSLTSMASQMPLFAVRKQKLVDRLARGLALDPTQIGVKAGRGELIWKNFYDQDDLLGYPVKGLYEDGKGNIGDYNVNTGWLPLKAHMRYWQNKDVLRETAELLSRRRL